MRCTPQYMGGPPIPPCFAQAIVLHDLLCMTIGCAVVDLVTAFDNFVKAHNANHGMTGTRLSPVSVRFPAGSAPVC